MKYKRYKHNPPHIFVDNTYYFLTAATYRKQKYFNTSERKDFLESTIINYFNKYQWNIDDYVILENHYHIKAKSRRGEDMPSIFRNIHRETSIYLKNHGIKKGVKIWWNYWDTIIQNADEYDFYTYYIWLNPTKHGYVTDVSKWKWMKLANLGKLEEEKADKILENKKFLTKICDDY